MCIIYYTIVKYHGYNLHLICMVKNEILERSMQNRVRKNLSVQNMRVGDPIIIKIGEKTLDAIDLRVAIEEILSEEDVMTYMIGDNRGFLPRKNYEKDEENIIDLARKDFAYDISGLILDFLRYISEEGIVMDGDPYFSIDQYEHFPKSIRKLNIKVYTLKSNDYLDNMVLKKRGNSMVFVIPPYIQKALSIEEGDSLRVIMKRWTINDNLNSTTIERYRPYGYRLNDWDHHIYSMFISDNNIVRGLSKPAYTDIKRYIEIGHDLDYEMKNDNKPKNLDHVEYFQTANGDVILTYQPYQSVDVIEAEDRSWAKEMGLDMKVLDSSHSWYSPQSCLVIVTLPGVKTIVTKRK